MILVRIVDAVTSGYTPGVVRGCRCWRRAGKGWRSGGRDFIARDSRRAAGRLAAPLPRFRNFGGSHVQTEVFEDTAIAALETSGRRRPVAELLEARLARRPGGRDERWLARLG